MRFGRALSLACATSFVSLVGCQALLDLPVASESDGGGASAGGEGATNDVATPGEGGALVKAAVSRVTIGAQHSCAVTTAGEFYCWGLDLRNAFGIAEVVTTGGPLKITRAMPLEGEIVGASAGVSFTCVVNRNGRVSCAGNNESAQVAFPPTSGPQGPWVVPLKSTRRAVSVCAGEREATARGFFAHACALVDDGKVECWGANDFGQLGVAADADVGHAPTQVPLPPNDPVQQIACGPARVCAVTMAHKVFCWGAEGDANFINQTAPVEVKVTADQVAVGASALFTLRDGIVSRQDTFMAQPVPLPYSDVTVVRAAAGNVCVLSKRIVRCEGSALFVSSWETSGRALFASKGPVDDFDVGPFHVCATTPNNDVICFGRNHTAEVTADGVIDDSTPTANRVFVIPP